MKQFNNKTGALQGAHRRRQSPPLATMPRSVSRKSGKTRESAMRLRWCASRSVAATWASITSQRGVYKSATSKRATKRAFGSRLSKPRHLTSESGSIDAGPRDRTGRAGHQRITLGAQIGNEAGRALPAQLPLLGNAARFCSPKKAIASLRSIAKKPRAASSTSGIEYWVGPWSSTLNKFSATISGATASFR